MRSKRLQVLFHLGCHRLADHSERRQGTLHSCWEINARYYVNARD